MKKQILIPVIIFSCFVGGGLGSLVDSSALQANIFTDLWNNLIDKSKEEEVENAGGKILFWTTWQGKNLPRETQQKFMDLQYQHEHDFGILVGIGVEEDGETSFLPGNILQSDKDTYLQTQEFRRTLAMIKVGVDSIQYDLPIIRTLEDTWKWVEIKNAAGGEEKKTDMWRELGNIIKLMQEVCTKQRSDIQCK